MLISPCDGLLSVYPIMNDLRIPIKHSTYSVGSLLQDRVLALQFSGGLCCVFRLEPRHYHRYIYAVSGTIQKQRQIPGILHSVRPIACTEYPVYVQNSREYTLIRNPLLGKVIQMEIGALLVGKIHNHKAGQLAECGMEKGYFEHGGSTVVLLFQKNVAQLMPEYNGLLHNECELPVKSGQVFGRIL